MKVMTKLLTATLVSSAVLASSAIADTTMKVGVVDAAKVYQAVPQGQATANQVRDGLKPEVQALTKEQQSLADQAKQLEKDRPSLSESDYNTKQAALNAKMQAFQQKYMQIRQEDTQKSQQLAQNFEKQFTQSVSELGKKDGYDLILVKQAVPYYKGSFDVTDEVVKEMKADASKS
ncbi:OmpH family outer membrane protein [Thiotrichales bacterium 19S3-7]|nr:OmpH family outer membrane protein [Thiotrichales bacterium 19S3-7]MCF6802402.1 OmpH family outer membrane protein [Thiotrichales bacterium 19S3-11]